MTLEPFQIHHEEQGLLCEIFFLKHRILQKKKLKHTLWKRNVIYLEFYPQYYFNLNLHYHKHVPPRYIYNINAMWTPYYILLFYLSKLYRDGTNWTFYLYNSNNLDTNPVSTYFRKCTIRRILRRKGYFKKNYLPKNAINIIRCYIHDTVNTYNKIMYKYYRRTIPWWMRAQQRRRIWAWIRRKRKRNKRKRRWVTVKWLKQNKIKKISNSNRKDKAKYYRFLKHQRQQWRKKKISKHKYKSNYYKVLKQQRRKKKKKN